MNPSCWTTSFLSDEDRMPEGLGKVKGITAGILSIVVACNVLQHFVEESRHRESIEPDIRSLGCRVMSTGKRDNPVAQLELSKCREHFTRING